jgi:hypothetical protein
MTLQILLFSRWSLQSHDSERMSAYRQAPITSGALAIKVIQVKKYVRLTMAWAGTLLSAAGCDCGRGLAGESATVRDGSIAFREVAAASNVCFRFEAGSAGRHHLPEIMGGGVAILDADGDGRLDLIQANGHVLDRARLGIPLAMRPTLLRGLGSRLDDVSRSSGAWFNKPIVGRGLAVGDLDGDCRPDVAVCALDAPAALLRNDSLSGHILAVRLRNRHGQPAVGARVRATVAGRVQVRDVVSGGSYLSCSDPTLFFGMGLSNRVDRLEVQLPWGSVESWSNLVAGRVYRLEPHGVAR